jgi:para-aminobenzoate synthetase component I
VHIERIGELGDAPAVLLAVADLSPAALIGDWFGSRAVIAPRLTAAPVETRDVFATTPSTAAADGRGGGAVGGGAVGGGAVGGGWMGYLSYPDAGAEGKPPRIPVAAGGWADCVLRQDLDGIWWYESISGAPKPSWLTRALARQPNLTGCRVDWGVPDRDTHRAGVLACLEAIAAGEVYQACVCAQITGAVTGSPVEFFAEAVARTAPARAAFVSGAWGAVASLSPELFMRRRGETVTSSPIKGTVPWYVAPTELLHSVKDVAENIMIVDLVRNDLGRVAATGSVITPELLAVRPAPGVWHLVSTVSARVSEDVPIATLLDATFPPASVTGTPKTRARQLLSQWEPYTRGIFCGTIGLASPTAGTELNVAIRTVEFDAHGGAVLGVGGGITADSDPDCEWNECLHKTAPIVGIGQRDSSFASFARSTAS